MVDRLPRRDKIACYEQGVQQQAISRPIVGVSPMWTAPQGDLRARESAIDAIMDSLLAAGALPLLMPLTDDEGVMKRCLELCDGFVLQGGADVDPRLWGEPLGRNADICPRRDAFEIPLARMVIAADKPLLAICRGMQLLNVCLGGTLAHDVEALAHARGGTPCTHLGVLDEAAHEVEVACGSLLSRCMSQATRIAVNSNHHECVSRLAPALSVCGLAPDGVVEAVELPGARFILGVQWHPECMWGSIKSDYDLLRAFSLACSEL